MSRVGVLLDRDGTVSCEKGYINHVDRFSLYSNSAKAIRLLNEADIPVVLITNQAGVARGYFPFELVDQVHQKLDRLLLEQGNARLDGIYYCPHHKDGIVEPYNVRCNCRKPATGLVDRATADHDLDLASSFMVGDKISDVELAKNIGAAGILVKTGYGRGELEYFSKGWTVDPDYIAEDLYDAVLWILKKLGRN